MVFNYSKMQRTADKLIRRFGNSGFVARFSENYAERPASIVVTDFEIREIDGTRIQQGDKKILVSAFNLGFTIEPTDRIRDAKGTLYEIIPPVRDVDPSASVIVVYELVCRA